MTLKTTWNPISSRFCFISRGLIESTISKQFKNSFRKYFLALCLLSIRTLIRSEFHIVLEFSRSCVLLGYGSVYKIGQYLGILASRTIKDFFAFFAYSMFFECWKHERVNERDALIWQKNAQEWGPNLRMIPCGISLLLQKCLFFFSTSSIRHKNKVSIFVFFVVRFILNFIA